MDGALHEAPVSTFAFRAAADFFFSTASAGAQARSAESSVTSREFRMRISPPGVTIDQ
jgi:hypothetical protein